MKRAKEDFESGQKSNYPTGSVDEYSLGMGAWGVTYHYTITATNDTDEERFVDYCVRNTDNVVVGYNNQEGLEYTTKLVPNIGNDDDWYTTSHKSIPPKLTIVYEAALIAGAGHGGLCNSIFIR